MLIVALALGAGSFEQAVGDAPQQVAPDPPNIVMILADDLGLDQFEHMPLTQASLVAQGMTFTEAIVSKSHCCPSRVSMFTGQYMHNHGVTWNLAPVGGYAKVLEKNLEPTMLPVWLKSAGYRTSYDGKYMNEYPATRGNSVPVGWDDWHVLQTGASGPTYTVNDNGVVTRYATATDGHHDDRFFASAVSAIRTEAPGDQPFFVQVAPVAPHTPGQYADRFADHFGEVSAPRTPSYDEADIADKPAHMQELPRLTDDVRLEMDRVYRNELRALQSVDEGVAAVIAALTDVGELDNTYIVLTSDNGAHTGQHRLPHGKEYPYEEDLRVPLVVAGPGIAPGSTSSALVTNLDLPVTLADLAGVAPLTEVDGRSFRPVLEGGAGPRVAQLIEHTRVVGALPIPGPGPGGFIPSFAGVRTDRYTYVAYETGEVELYDRVVDPYQLVNIAGSAPPELLAALEARTRALESCVGQECRVADSVADPSGLTPTRRVGLGAFSPVVTESTGPGDDLVSLPLTVDRVSTRTAITVPVTVIGDARLVSARIEPGSSVGSITFAVPRDDTPETGETIQLSLGSPDGPGAEWLTPTSSISLTVVDDDAPCTIMGTSRNDRLLGTAGNDVICGLGGNDVILAGDGHDIIRGSVGDDRLFGEAGDDIMIGGPGADTLLGSTGRDRLVPGDERLADTSADAVNGGHGSDEVSYLGAASGVTVDLAAGTAVGDGADSLVGIEDVSGSRHDDVLIGNSLDNRLRGTDGNDRLTGRAGLDIIDGGANRPLSTIKLLPSASSDGDVVDYSTALFVSANFVTGSAVNNQGADVLVGIEGLVGTPGRDSVVGGSNGLHLTLGGGNDRATLGAGDDLVDSGAGDDFVRGGAGFDGIRGGTGSDRLYGDADSDLIEATGADGVDLLVGGGGPFDVCRQDDVAVPLLGCDNPDRVVIFWPT